MEGVLFPLKDGQVDPGLHPNGQNQAKPFRNELNSMHIGTIYVTTLQKIHQTATFLAEAPDISTQVEANFRKVYLGDLDGDIFRKKTLQKDNIVLNSFEQCAWREIPRAATA